MTPAHPQDRPRVWPTCSGPVGLADHIQVPQAVCLNLIARGQISPLPQEPRRQRPANPQRLAEVQRSPGPATCSRSNPRNPHPSFGKPSGVGRYRAGFIRQGGLAQLNNTIAAIGLP